jgi:hypothetical protein
MADNLPPSCADVNKSGGINLLEPCGPVQACNGTAFPLPFFFKKTEKILRLEVDSAASSEGRRKQTYFMYFPWPPIEAKLSIRRFVFTDTLLLIALSSKKFTRHPASVSTILIVCYD